MYIYITDIYVQFSKELYRVDESAGYAILKVTVNGFRTSPISVKVKIFVSNEIQPKAGSYVAKYNKIIYVYCIATYIHSCIIS